MSNTLHFVAIYLTDRAYGGPEEGGWHYDCGDPANDLAEHTKSFDSEDDAYKYCDTIQHIIDDLNEGRYPKSSVLSDGEYMSIVSEGEPKSYPTTRPYYE